jgi:hypothetical protein
MAAAGAPVEAPAGSREVRSGLKAEGGARAAWPGRHGGRVGEARAVVARASLGMA